MRNPKETAVWGLVAAGSAAALARLQTRPRWEGTAFTLLLASCLVGGALCWEAATRA